MVFFNSLNSDLLWRYHFDMFVLCVSEASVTSPFAAFPLPPLLIPSAPLVQAGGEQL